MYIYIYWCRHGSSWRFYLPPLWVATELLQPCCSRTTRVMLWTHTPPFDATIWSRWETERTQLQSWVLGPGSWVQWNPASLFRVNATPSSMNHLRPLKSLNHPRQGVLYESLYDIIHYYTILYGVYPKTTHDGFGWKGFLQQRMVCYWQAPGAPGNQCWWFWRLRNGRVVMWPCVKMVGSWDRYSHCSHLVNENDDKIVIGASHGEDKPLSRFWVTDMESCYDLHSVYHTKRRFG